MLMFGVPDCRNDENYNEDFLEEDDKRELQGYDWCTEEAVDEFFENLNLSFGEDDYLFHILNEKLPEYMQGEAIKVEFNCKDKEPETRTAKTYKDILHKKLREWIEERRNLLITAMIDAFLEGSPEEDEYYQKIKQKAMEKNAASKNPKKYYDTMAP